MKCDSGDKSEALKWIEKYIDRVWRGAGWLGLSHSWFKKKKNKFYSITHIHTPLASLDILPDINRAVFASTGCLVIFFFIQLNTSMLKNPIDMKQKNVLLNTRYNLINKKTKIKRNRQLLHKMTEANEKWWKMDEKKRKQHTYPHTKAVRN